MALPITVVLDLPADHEFHRATLAALSHAAGADGTDLELSVMRTSEWGGDPSLLGAGVLVGPGSPYESEDAAYAVIRTARESGLPLLGT